MDIMAEAMGAALADDLDISDSDDEDGGGGGEGGGNNDQESQTSNSYFICQIDFEIINSILLSPLAGHRRQDGGGARGSPVGARAPAARRGRHLVLSRLAVCGERPENVKNHARYV